jgi:hypothetical protein
MEDLVRALPALLKEFDENETVREAVVFAVWRRVAGESLREHAIPIRLFQKHLIIAVASDTWKKHLEHLSGQMIFKLNSALKQATVTFIEFRVDEETILQERARNKKSTLSDAELEEIALEEVTPNLRVSADAIKDDNLRYQFLLAAGSCLARKKKLVKSEK